MDAENDSSALRDFQFALEVSTRYHDWRRAKLGVYVNVVRMVALAGAIITLITLVGDWSQASKILIATNLIVAVVILFDLVFQLDSKARKHDVLYQRFKNLQASEARGAAQWRDKLPEWQAEAQTIRIDEPPVYWG